MRAENRLGGNEMTIRESLDVLAGWIEERTREKRYPKSEVKELSKALLNIRDMAEDQLTSHKWPEEKPEKGGQYLIRIISPSGSVYYSLRGYEDGEWHNFGNYITHWWNLPEVTE